MWICQRELRFAVFGWAFFPEQGCSSSGQHSTGAMLQTLAATLCNNIFEAFLLLYPEEIGNYPKVFQHHRMTPGSSTSMTILMHKAAVSSLFRHSQQEVRAIMKKVPQVQWREVEEEGHLGYTNRALALPLRLHLVKVHSSPSNLASQASLIISNCPFQHCPRSLTFFAPTA